MSRSRPLMLTVRASAVTLAIIWMSTGLAEPPESAVLESTQAVRELIFPDRQYWGIRPKELEWVAVARVVPFGFDSPNPKEYWFTVARKAGGVDARIVALIGPELKEHVRKLMVEMPKASVRDLADRIPRVDESTTSAECPVLVPIATELEASAITPVLISSSATADVYQLSVDGQGASVTLSWGDSQDAGSELEIIRWIDRAWEVLTKQCGLLVPPGTDEVRSAE